MLFQLPRGMLELNPGLLRLEHQQSDALITRLYLIIYQSIHPSGKNSDL
jgi:hypothetical protein